MQHTECSNLTEVATRPLWWYTEGHIYMIACIYIYIYIYDKMQNAIVQVKSSKNEEDERRFRGSKIFSRGYFEGQEFFFVGTLWVQKCFS